MRGQFYARRSGGHHKELQYLPKLYKSEIKRAGISTDQTSHRGANHSTHVVTWPGVVAAFLPPLLNLELQMQSHHTVQDVIYDRDYQLEDSTWSKVWL